MMKIKWTALQDMQSNPMDDSLNIIHEKLSTDKAKHQGKHAYGVIKFLTPRVPKRIRGEARPLHCANERINTMQASLLENCASTLVAKAR